MSNNKVIINPVFDTIYDQYFSTTAIQWIHILQLTLRIADVIVGGRVQRSYARFKLVSHIQRIDRNQRIYVIQCDFL